MRTLEITLGGRQLLVAPLTIGQGWDIDDEVDAQPESRRSSYYLVSIVHAAAKRAMGPAAPTVREIADLADLEELEGAVAEVLKLTGRRRAPSGETPSS